VVVLIFSFLISVAARKRFLEQAILASPCSAIFDAVTTLAERIWVLKLRRRLT
jgi:hypothetical protein